jgi:long-chain acyl-CoA synthetase
MMEKDSMRSVPVADEQSHRVATAYKGKLARTPGSGVDTLYAVSKRSFEKYADLPCMQKRQFLGMKSSKVKEFGPDIITYTYKEVGEIVHKFGAALRAAGCVPSGPTTDLEKITTPCRMAIFENTSPEWLMAALGATTQSITIVTVYATLGLDAVVEAITDNIIPVIICNKANVKNLVDKKKNMPSLKAIVYTNDLVAPNDTMELPAAPNGVTIMSFDEFVASGDTKAYPPTPPTPTSTSTVMYTSGSTGKPKGVVIKQESVVGGVASADILIKITPGDTYLAYLPAAHIMEFMVEFTVIAFGGTLAFADPKSLTQTGSYPVGALEQYKPTLMVAVPKIWDTIKKGLLAKVRLTSSGLVFTHGLLFLSQKCLVLLVVCVLTSSWSPR